MSGSVSVSPSEIRRRIERGEQYEEALTVRNVGSERGSYSIHTEEGFRDWVDAEPDLFAINAQDARAIALVLKTDNARKGRNTFTITVIHDENEEDRGEVRVTLIIPRAVSRWGITLAVILVLFAAITGAVGLLGIL